MVGLLASGVSFNGLVSKFFMVSCFGSSCREKLSKSISIGLFGELCIYFIKIMERWNCDVFSSNVGRNLSNYSYFYPRLLDSKFMEIS